MDRPRIADANLGLRHVFLRDMVLSASIKSGYTTLQQLLDQLRKDGAAVNFGTAGPGSTGHIGAVLFLHVTRNNATLVSYRGAGPALADLMAGTVDTVIDQTVTMIPIHKGGRVRALAVSGKQRVEQIPDVPTFAEAGAPAFDLSVWNGIAAPAGTPQAVVARLAQALAAALKDPEVIDRFGKMAAVIPPAVTVAAAWTMKNSAAATRPPTTTPSTSRIRATGMVASP